MDARHPIAMAPRVYWDAFCLLERFLRPTTKTSSFESAVAALSVVELAYLMEATMLLRIDLGQNYRLLLTLSVMVMALFNFAYFYPKRHFVPVGPSGSKRYRIAIGGVLFLPVPFLFVIIGLAVGGHL